MHPDLQRALAEQIGQMVLQLVEQQLTIETQAKQLAEKRTEDQKENVKDADR